VINEEAHSRIPVFKGTIDTIVGILYTKDVLSWISQHTPEEWTLETLIKKPHFVPAGKKIDDLLAELKNKQVHLAIVVDEYGGTAGIVTMEDILEEIVGEIQDEYDREEEPIVKISENSFLVDPQIDLHDLEEELGIALDLEEADYNTLGGLIYHEYGDVPTENTTIEHNGMKIVILKMDNQRIEKVQVDVIRQKSNSAIDEGAF
jgi:CBS domain containing-hemolysin-like protein